MSSIKIPIRKSLNTFNFLKKEKNLQLQKAILNPRRASQHPRMRHHCNNPVFLLDGSMNTLALQAPPQRQGNFLSP